MEEKNYVGYVEAGGLSEIVRFQKEGEKFEGRLIAKRTFVNVRTGKENYLFVFQKENGTRVGVFGQSQLNLKMQEVPVNADVVIIYEGKRQHPKKRGMTMHYYRVLYKVG
jgi:hypothetical protein